MATKSVYPKMAKKAKEPTSKGIQILEKYLHTTITNLEGTLDDILHDVDAITSDGTPISLRTRDITEDIKRYHWSQWKNQITLRCKVFSGNKTEYQKVLDGEGKLFFYCWYDYEGFKKITLIDLDILRRIIKDKNYPTIPNKDKKSFFHPISRSDYCYAIIWEKEIL